MSFERISERLLEILIKIIHCPVTRTSKTKKCPLSLNILENSIFIFFISSQKNAKGLVIIESKFEIGASKESEIIMTLVNRI